MQEISAREKNLHNFKRKIFSIKILRKTRTPKSTSESTPELTVSEIKFYENFMNKTVNDKKYKY